MSEPKKIALTIVSESERIPDGGIFTIQGFVGENLLSKIKTTMEKKGVVELTKQEYDYLCSHASSPDRQHTVELYAMVFYD